jgi:hypothetical protein
MRYNEELIMLSKKECDGTDGKNGNWMPRMGSCRGAAGSKRSHMNSTTWSFKTEYRKQL